MEIASARTAKCLKPEIASLHNFLAFIAFEICFISLRFSLHVKFYSFSLSSLEYEFLYEFFNIFISRNANEQRRTRKKKGFALFGFYAREFDQAAHKY
jgi:hypothetical protein